MKASKRILPLLSWLLLAMLSVSCSSEEHPVEPPLEPKKSTSLTFTVGGLAKQAVTYSEVNGDDRIETLDIYMFGDASGKLAAVFHFTGDELEQAAPPTNEVLVPVDVTNHSGGYDFYFVANAKGYASSLSDINVEVTTEDEFCRRLSDICEHGITLPLLMTASGRVENIELPQASETAILLGRRMACIGIDNDPAVSGFTIDKILVSNANLQTGIFGIGHSTETFPTGSLPEVDYASLPAANTSTPVEKAFYMFPTSVEEGKTEIWLDGTFKGKKLLYRLQPGFRVEANHHYILKVAETAYGMEVLPSVIISGGGGIWGADKWYDVSNLTEATQIAIPVRTYSGMGTSIEIHYTDGTPYPGIVYTSQPQASLPDGGYMEEYRLYIPVQNAPFRAEVIIINNRLSNDRDTLYIDGLPNYPNTLLKPVRVGGIYWAPVNAGVEGTGATPEAGGSLFQWGRNAFFAYFGEGSDLYGTIGPVFQTTADSEGARNKFICVGADPYDWLTPQNDELWSGVQSRGPCPPGWRVPTDEELNIFTTLYQNGRVTWDKQLKGFRVRGDNEISELFLPAAGFRSNRNGGSSQRGTAGYYWSSSANDKTSSRLRVMEGGVDMNINHRATANSVRCVQGN